MMSTYCLSVNRMNVHFARRRNCASNRSTSALFSSRPMTIWRNTELAHVEAFIQQKTTESVLRVSRNGIIHRQVE